MQPVTPPTYTQLHIEHHIASSEDLPPHFSTIQHNELPTYAQSRRKSGWNIVIRTRVLVDGYRIFVSPDAANKFNEFKKKKKRSHEITQLQKQGYGVPLFKVTSSYVPFSKKFLTFRKYAPRKGVHSFDENKDYYDYCTVIKTTHIGYDSYIFEFSPDPDAPWLNFTVVMFSHNILPINDYIFRGRKHRWVDETRLLSKERQAKHGFRHTILSPSQVSLTDNWDGTSDRLTRNTENVYLTDDIERCASMSYGATNVGFPRHAKAEYYGQNFSRILRVSEPTVRTVSNEVKIGDVNDRKKDIDYESIFAIDEDDLVTICIAAVLKRQKDIQNKIEMAAKASHQCK
jgi:hypothetical protein